MRSLGGNLAILHSTLSATTAQGEVSEGWDVLRGAMQWSRLCRIIDLGPSQVTGPPSDLISFVKQSEKIIKILPSQGYCENYVM